MSFDPTAIVEVLNRHEVRYVVIGAYAAIAHGAIDTRTQDIGVTPERTKANLARLSSALTELDARVWADSAPEGLSFAHDATSLARQQDFLNLVCKHGRVDVCFRPDGFPDGYRDLARDAVTVLVDGHEVLVASLADVITSKRASGRAKDLAVVPDLVRHLRRTSSLGGPDPQ